MKILVFAERSAVRGGIEVFAERHVAQLRAEGHEVEVVNDLRHETRDDDEPPFSRFDEIIVHKCSDVATLEQFPPEKHAARGAVALHFLRTALPQLEVGAEACVRPKAANRRDGEIQEARRHLELHEVAPCRQRH